MVTKHNLPLMRGIRPSPRWLLSAPPIGRQCLLLAHRGLSHYRSHHDLRQFSAISPRYDNRGGFASEKPFLAQQQSLQSRRFTQTSTNPAKTASRSLVFLVFPFVSTTTSARSLPSSTHQHGGFRRRAIWLYRIVWLLGIGYTTSVFLLSDPLSAKSDAIFNPPRFTPFTIIDRQDVSPSSFILTIRPDANTNPDIDPYADSWNRGTWSVEFKQPQLQIARSYTPLPPSIDAQNKSDLQFLIRREEGGEMSNYLANLPIQATVHLRGPHPEVDLPMDIKNVVFVAGGTGIAPAMQVMHTLLDRRTNTPKPRINILWANRKRADCMGGVSSFKSKSGGTNIKEAIDLPIAAIVRELQLFQERHENLEINYFVDEEGSFLDRKSIPTHTKSAIREGTEARDSAEPSTSLLFVSGPEGFVSYLAGPKKWEDGKEKQGKLGGLFAQLMRTDLMGFKVWKM